MIDVQCSECGYKLQAGEEHAGQTGKCPKCGGAVNVPSLQEPSPPPEPEVRGGGFRMTRRRIILAVLAVLLGWIVVWVVRGEMRVRHIQAVMDSIDALVEANADKAAEVSARIDSYFSNDYFYKWSQMPLGTGYLGEVEIYVGQKWHDLHYLDRVQAAKDVIIWRELDEETLWVDGVEFLDETDGKVIATYNPLDGYQVPDE